MFKDFSKSAFANGCLGHINENDRKRSEGESYIRIGLNSHPIGAAIDTTLNAAEFYGHRTKDNANAYYDRNIMNHSDKFERGWDSYKRATDLEYSAGNDCNVF